MKRVHRLFCLSIILIFGFIIRLQNLNMVFGPPVLPAGFDPYYQLRLAEAIVKSGYRPEFDYYLNYPFGLKVGWLPLFQYILAFPGVIFGFKATEIFAVFLPPVLGVISTFMVYLIAKRVLKNDYHSLLSTLFFAASPAVVSTSILGFSDHHAWVVTLVLASAYFLLVGGYYILLSGVSLTIMALSWLGAPIYAAILALSVLLSFEDERDMVYAAIAFAIPAVSFFMTPVGLSFVALSVFLAFGTLAKRKGLELQYFAACVIIVAILYLIPAGYFGFIKSGLDYMLGRGIYLPTIAEAKSFQVSGIMWKLGLFAFMISIPAALLLKDRFVKVWFLSSLALALLQVRFVELAAAPMAILAAYTVCLTLDRMDYPVFESETENRDNRIVKKSRGGRRKNSRNREAKQKEELSKGDIAFAIFFIAFILLPSFVVDIKPFDMSEDWKNALLWLKENTEVTSYYYNPEKKPEYSVLSWWDYGNWIVYVAKRPVVANNFQAGARDAARFFTAQSEEEAMKIVKRRGVRYVVTDFDMWVGNKTKSGKFLAIMKIAGLNPDFMNRSDILEFYNNSMYYRLHFENAAGLEHFRLLRDFGSVKVFEVI